MRPATAFRRYAYISPRCSARAATDAYSIASRRAQPNAHPRIAYLRSSAPTNRRRMPRCPRSLPTRRTCSKPTDDSEPIGRFLAPADRTITHGVRKPPGLGFQARRHLQSLWLVNDVGGFARGEAADRAVTHAGEGIGGIAADRVVDREPTRRHSLQ